MFNVKINNISLSAFNGENLRDFLINNGFYINSPCGGNGTCGKCVVTVNGEKIKSCSYSIKSDITVTLSQEDNFISNSGLTETAEYCDNFALCLDVGTSTLALAKVDLEKGNVLKVVTKTNSQRVFGADVISRIDYCKKNSVKALTDSLIEQINHMINEFEVTKNVSLFVSGNTTMLHFLFGEDASSLGTYPYTPVFIEEKNVSGKALGLKNINTVYSLPCVSAFVGADLVAGLNCVEMPHENKYNILVDLGTNAEILVFSKNKVICTSAAAGPCFEGGNISCGMSATDGAIYKFFISDKKEKIFETVGNKKACGICGTGLIDIIATFLKEKRIDDTGYIDEDIKITENVFISQKDIRQFQLAKAAVYTAISTLMKIENISFEAVEKLYVSGGFANGINIENAVYTGLLPEKLKNKIIVVNNTSLCGTIKYALHKNNPFKNFEKVQFVDLAINPDFSNSFIKNIDFLSGDDYE